MKKQKVYDTSQRFLIYLCSAEALVNESSVICTASINRNIYQALLYNIAIIKKIQIKKCKFININSAV